MTDTTDSASPNVSRPPVKSARGRRILSFVLVLLLLLLGAAGYFLYRIITPSGGRSAAAKVNGVTWVRSIYGIDNTPAGALTRATAAVSASNGNIWVVDGVHKALLGFTPDGRYTGQLAGPAAAPLTQPGRFAIGPDGKFYVTEALLNDVRVISAANQEAGSFMIPQPVSVAVSEDRIVVGSVSGFAILDKAGKPIKVLGSRGKGEDQFDYVHGVAIADNGNIYVVDSYNNRLSAYDPSGKRLWIRRTGKAQNSAQSTDRGPLTVPEPTGTVLKGDNAMQLPLGLTIDGAGRLVVVDMFDCTLNVFDSKNGAFIAKYGEAGAEDGQFFYPVSVGYDKGRDWFTVADQLNDRVEVVRLPGSAGSSAAQASVGRVLAGPLRACFFPFLILLLAIAVWLATRAVRRRGRVKVAQGDLSAAPSAATGAESETTSTVVEKPTEDSDSP